MRWVGFSAGVGGERNEASMSLGELFALRCAPGRTPIECARFRCIVNRESS
jgi:hypothetical protein